MFVMVGSLARSHSLQSCRISTCTNIARAARISSGERLVSRVAVSDNTIVHSRCVRLKGNLLSIVSESSADLIKFKHSSKPAVTDQHLLLSSVVTVSDIEVSSGSDPDDESSGAESEDVVVD